MENQLNRMTADYAGQPGRAAWTVHMHSHQAEELDWVRARLQDRISLTSWVFTIVLGLWLWSLLFRLL